MANIDVNDVLVDPDLASEFSVVRRGETVGPDGRPRFVDERTDGLLGVITWEDAPIERRDDGTLVPQSIRIATPFSLRDASMGYQADLVIWQGETYRVSSIKPHRHLGRGWTRATASSARATDNPPANGRSA